jgi:hypothetical protein
VLFRQLTCSPPVVQQTDPCHTDSTCGNAHDCWEHDPNIIGLTTTTYDKNSGKILDADIELNGQAADVQTGFKFTTVDLPPAFRCPIGQTAYTCVAADIQNTATHEFGHALGLDHTGYTPVNGRSQQTQGRHRLAAVRLRRLPEESSRTGLHHRYQYPRSEFGMQRCAGRADVGARIARASAFRETASPPRQLKLERRYGGCMLRRG